MFKAKLKSYILFGIEIEHDCLYAKDAIAAFKNADFVLNFASFKSKYLLETSDVILPIASSYEISGTFINLTGLPQSFNAVIPHDYEVKQGWLAINELANNLKQPDFNYTSIEEILKEIKLRVNLKNTLKWDSIHTTDLNSCETNDFAILPVISNYSTDSLVRRSHSLQKTYTKTEKSVRLNSTTYQKLKINGTFILIKNKKIDDTNKYFILIDNNIADDTMIIDSKNILDNTEFMLPCDSLSFEKS